MKVRSAFLSLLAAILFTQCANGQTSDSLSVLLINPAVLTKVERENITYSLLQLNITNNILDTIVLKKRQVIYNIVKDSFKLRGEVTNSITNKVIQQISTINDIADPNKVSENQAVVVPRNIDAINTNLESRNYNYAFVVDLFTNNSYIQVVDSLLLEGMSSHLPPSLLEQIRPSLLAYKLSASDYKQFLDSIPDKIKNSLAGQGYKYVQMPTILGVDDTIKVQSADHSIKPVTDKYNEEVKELLESIDTSNFGLYYVFDKFYSDSCTHGKKVVDVIKLTLEGYGCGHLSQRIKEVPLNVLGNEKLIELLLNDLLDTSGFSNDERQLVSKLDFRMQLAVFLNPNEFLRKQLARDELCCPELVMSAFLNEYYRNGVDVISTSCAFKYPRPVFPRIRKDATTLILTAASNEDNMSIESLFDVGEPDKGEFALSLQPLAAYFSNYSTVAAGMIVGNCISPGIYKGMVSQDGSRITTLGYGTGYVGACIASDDLGTSFATPRVGTQVYLAKGYWKSKKIDLTPLAVRDLVMLSSDLDKNFEGKFASSGVLNTYKLMLSPTGFIQNDTGEIFPLVVEYRESFLVTAANDTITFSNTDKNAILGLSFHGSDVFSFSSQDGKWKRQQVRAIKLKLIFSGATLNFDSLEEVQRSIKHIVFPTFKT